MVTPKMVGPRITCMTDISSFFRLNFLRLFIQFCIVGGVVRQISWGGKYQFNGGRSFPHAITSAYCFINTQKQIKLEGVYSSGYNGSKGIMIIRQWPIN